MSAEEDRLYGLMEIAERQQVAVQAALEGLAAEREALARDRARLGRAVAALGHGTRQAVRVAVAEGFAGAAGKGVEAVQVATQPLLEELAGMTEGAARAEAALRRVVSWASWRLLGKITYCGDPARPCIAVDESAGKFGANSDYRVIKGY